MKLPSELLRIQGARELYDWFGYWPDFHDAEVVQLELKRVGSSILSIDTWQSTDETGSDGYHVRVKNISVDFVLDEISNLDLKGFSHQNVVGNIRIEANANGFLVTLWPCYGLSGTIEVSRISIKLRPSNI